jgi:hypothetical protein
MPTFIFSPSLPLLLCLVSALYFGLVLALLVAASRADEAMGGPSEGNDYGGDRPRGTGTGGNAPRGDGDGGVMAQGEGEGRAHLDFAIRAHTDPYQRLYAAERALAQWDTDQPGGLIFEEPHEIIVEVVR